MEKTFLEQLQETTNECKKKLAEQKIKDEAEGQQKLFKEVKDKLEHNASFGINYCNVLSHFGFKKKHSNEPKSLSYYHAWNNLEDVKKILDDLGVYYSIHVEKCEGKKNKNHIFTLKASW